MKNNYLLWLIGGAALYFLTRKKETTGSGPAATPEDIDLSPAQGAPASTAPGSGTVAQGPAATPSSGGPILETNQSYTFSA
jgi:hypothetical protein